MKNLNNIIDNYFKQFSEEKEKLWLLQKQLELWEDLKNRKNFNWHITASSSLLDFKNKKILLIHNKALNKWLTPGWHHEKIDDDMLNNAKRELEEETGIKNCILHNWHINSNIPINIDTHYIPKNIKKEEKEHYHHDFNYVFIIDKWNNFLLQKEEIDWLEWIDINDKNLKIHAIEKIRNLIFN